MMLRRPPRSPLFPYTTLFRSERVARHRVDVLEQENLDLALGERRNRSHAVTLSPRVDRVRDVERERADRACGRSEEHTSELQSHVNLVCRLLLEKKKNLNQLH